MNKPSWSSGYVSDALYTRGFYREMGAEHLAFCAAINGYSLPMKAGLRYCELGCGLGYGLLLQAAANPDREFVGVDFNPAHISEAKGLAEKARIGNVRFIEASFGDIAASEDPELGEFEIIALHGVLTWISPEVRGQVLEILRRRLKPGGVCYVSYNTMPGWAQTLPMQRLIAEVAKRTPGDSARRLSSATATLAALDLADSGYMKVNPAARTRFINFGSQSPQYLVHEYLNENWEPLYVTDVIDLMGNAKLDYAGSASVISNRLVFNVPERVMRLVSDAPDTAMRELIKDYVLNRQFRRDIYVKGGVRLGRSELERLYESMTLIRAGGPKELPEEWPIPIGTARPEKHALDAVLGAFGDSPVNIGTIRAHCEAEGIGWSDLPGIIELLINGGLLKICRADHATVDKTAAMRLNRAVFDLALVEDTHRYLASPVLGSAISAPYTERLLGGLLAEETEESPITAHAAQELLQRQGKRVTEKGEALEDSGEALEKLDRMLDTMREDALPLWRTLGIVAAA